MAHINVRSVLANLLDVKLLLIEKNLGILFVSETWLQPHTPDSHCRAPGYRVFRCDKGRGGGACEYIKDTLVTKGIDCDTDGPQGIEDIWVREQHRKLPSIKVGSVYRHPKAPPETFDYTHETLRTMCLKKKDVYMIGDFNDDMLSSNNKLNTIISLNNLYQMIDKPTHHTTFRHTARRLNHQQTRHIT